MELADIQRTPEYIYEAVARAGTCALTETRRLTLAAWVGPDTKQAIFSRLAVPIE